MSELRQEIRQAIRSLARRPAFVLVVVVTLGLGIGANSAIFSVVNAVLLKPLPYRAPERLAMIWSRWSNFDKTWLSDAEYQDYQRQDRLFEDVAAWAEDAEVALTGKEGTESAVQVEMTANFLAVVGMSPAAGRAFTAEEDVPNGAPVVMLGYELWQRRYAASPAVIGRTIDINGVARQVVGVLPRDFRFPLEFQSRAPAQLVQPLRPDRSSPARNNHGWYGVARLRPGVTAAMASVQLAALAHQWTEAGLYPAAMKFAPFAVPMVEQVSGNIRLALIVLMVAVALLLLLTCANVANLVLTRADARSRELAVRSALGAGRGELLRLALLESCLLGVSGGVLGLMLAWGGVKLLVARAPTSIPRLTELHVDWRVMLFALVLSLGTGVLFGVLPQMRRRAPALADTLREGARGQSAGASRKRARAALVMCEMALAVLLVIAACLTIRSFRNLQRLDPGFDGRGVLTLRTSLPASTFGDEASVRNFYREFGEKVRALPGVTAVGFVRNLPLASDMGDAGMVIEGRPVVTGAPGLQADWQAVSPGYFEALKIRLIKGRFITDADTKEGDQVIVINEQLAREYFPDVDPIGKRIRVGGADRPFRTVVGIVGNYHHNGLLASVKRSFFVPADQWSNSYGSPRRAMTLVVRSSGDAENLIPGVTRIEHALAPDIPVTQVTTMENVLATATQEQRFTMALMAGFAFLAIVLASVGIYGVIAYSVSERTREIGIRLALGSELGAVRALVLRQGMIPAVAGVGIGVVAALLLTRFLASILYGVAAIDAPTFLVMPLVLVAIAMASVLGPAVRASRVDPMEALRNE